MKFFLDANLNVALAEPLSTIFLTHQFVTARDLGLQGEEDTPLFGAVAEHGFDYFMTHDRNQLRNLDERHALWKSGLHWIGWSDPKSPGLPGLALETATVMAALPHILAERPAAPTCFHLTGVPAERGQRYKSRPVALRQWGS